MSGSCRENWRPGRRAPWPFGSSSLPVFPARASALLAPMKGPLASRWRVSTLAPGVGFAVRPPRPGVRAAAAGALERRWSGVLAGPPRAGWGQRLGGPRVARCDGPPHPCEDPRRSPANERGPGFRRRRGAERARKRVLGTPKTPAWPTTPPSASKLCRNLRGPCPPWPRQGQKPRTCLESEPPASCARSPCATGASSCSRQGSAATMRKWSPAGANL